MKLIQDFNMFTKNKGFFNKVATIFLNPCFHSVVIFRISQFFHLIKLNIISKVLWYLNRIVFSVDIDYRAELAGGLVLVHGLNVVIGKDVKSKGCLTIYQGVTIGGNGNRYNVDRYGKKYYQPIIENNVKLYTNACIFGPVLISENTIIKAGSIITKDVV